MVSRNNAGLVRSAIFHKMSKQQFDEVVDVHLRGRFKVSRAAAYYLRRQESGAYLHMTFTSGLIGNLGRANYSAANLGIVGLSKSIALDMPRAWKSSSDDARKIGGRSRQLF